MPGNDALGSPRSQGRSLLSVEDWRRRWLRRLMSVSDRSLVSHMLSISIAHPAPLLTIPQYVCPTSSIQSQPPPSLARDLQSPCRSLHRPRRSRLANSLRRSHQSHDWRPNPVHRPRTGVARLAAGRRCRWKGGTTETWRGRRGEDVQGSVHEEGGDQSGGRDDGSGWEVA
jgi:hypothetical protein